MSRLGAHVPAADAITHEAVTTGNVDVALLKSTQRATVYLLCAFAGIAEGFGLQSGGMAAPKFAAEFHMMPNYVGGIFLLTSLGLALGASVGGWWGDRVGAGRAMGVAVALFSLASIGSGMARSDVALAVMRTMTGLGLGGALPNMIALLTHVGPAASAPRRVTLSIAAISMGALAVGLIMLLAPSNISWRLIFHLGGWFALVVAVAIFLLLPIVRVQRSSQPVQSAKGGDRWRALFGRGHIMITLFLWLAFFVTGATSYLLINWMPTFLVQAGLDHHQVGIGMIGLAIGGAAGPMVLSGLLRPGRTRTVVCLAYCGIVLGLAYVICAPKSAIYLCSGIAFTGFFTSGTQAVLFGIVSAFYPATARGTGVGWAVAVGRIGSGAGPALAGVMLAAGLTQGWVLAAAVPMLLLALVALLLLLRRPPEVLRAPSRT
jgi:MFS transporter, AAHS family, 3-hydroxyphenylpropionic acid transporter